MSGHAKKMKIGVWTSGDGAHVAAWRLPGDDPHRSAKIGYWTHLAKVAEKGKLDFVFLADSNRILYHSNPSAMSKMPATRVFEPLTLLSAMAMVTEHIGLVATMTTTYNEPFHVARIFASLDHISGGRGSWNVVTSSSADEAPNFTAEKHMAHDDRYARAKEFLEIVNGLWDSWEDDAFPRDAESGVYLDYDKLHYLNWKSERFSVKGPLNSPRSPQGRPVVFQAGSSDIGREFGAETADAIFTAQETFKSAQAFYKDIKSRAVKYGRNPDDIPIFCGVGPIVGRTVEEAREKYAHLQSQMPTDVALQLLSEVLGGADLSKIPLDVPVTSLPASDAIQSRRDLLLAKAIEEKMTLVELARYAAGGRGHRQIIGTPEMIADDFQYWVENGATDGFMLAPAALPMYLEDFVEMVVPELQRRGIFRTEYEGSTFRNVLEIPRPPHPAVLKK